MREKENENENDIIKIKEYIEEESQLNDNIPLKINNTPKKKYNNGSLNSYNTEKR